MSETSTSTTSGPDYEQIGSLVIGGLSKWFTPQTMGDIPALWDDFLPQIDSIPGKLGDVAYGVCYNTKPTGEGFDYIAGVEVSNYEALPPELDHLVLPARTYAVFTHNGPLATLKDSIDFIWQTWLPGSGREVDAGPTGSVDFFERYDETFNPDESGHIQLWVPVKA